MTAHISITEGDGGATYTINNEVDLPSEQQNLLSNHITRKYLSEEQSTEGKRLHLFCIKGGRIQEKWSFHF